MLKPIESVPLKGKPRLKVWAIGLLSGLLLTFSHPPAAIPGLGLIALAPLFLALPRLSAGGAFVMGALVALPYFTVNTWWLGQMVTDPGGEWIIFGMFVFVVLYMSFFYAVCAMVMRWMMTRSGRWLYWLVPLAWLGFEFINELNVPGPFPWLPLGASFVDLHWIVQTADIWGQYGLAALAAFTALALVAPLKLEGPGAALKVTGEKMFRYGMPATAALLLAGSCVYGVVRIGHFDRQLQDDGPLIALVQGNLPQEVKVSNDPQRIPRSYETHLRLTQEGVEAGAELVCWAETMLFGGSTREGYSRWQPELSARFFDDGRPSHRFLTGETYLPNGNRYHHTYVEDLRAQIAHVFETPMLVGAVNTIPEEEYIHDWKDYTFRAYNTAMHFDAEGRFIDSYDKRYTVPGGEYIPLEDLSIFGWRPVRDIVVGYAESLQGYASRIEPGLRLTLFRLPSQAERLDGRDWAYTATICYEYAFPGCYIELHERPDRYPDFHVNISNEGWFKRSAELDQAVDFCRLRSIESRMPMVRSTNTGITCSIDATGRVVEVLTVDGDDREVEGVMITRPLVLKDPKPTIFVSMVGRGPAWLSLILSFSIMGLMTVGRVQDRRQRKRSKKAAAKDAAGDKA
jgi:apolipoprotein N-acyltransferase